MYKLQLSSNFNIFNGGWTALEIRASFLNVSRTSSCGVSYYIVVLVLKNVNFFKEAHQSLKSSKSTKDNILRKVPSKSHLDKRLYGRFT